MFKFLVIAVSIAPHESTGTSGNPDATYGDIFFSRTRTGVTGDKGREHPNMEESHVSYDQGQIAITSNYHTNIFLVGLGVWYGETNPLIDPLIDRRH